MKLMCLAMMASAVGGECTEDVANVDENTNDGNYNIILITTDQEHYFQEYPQETDYQARLRLRALGTTFHKHYACSNVSTSSRSVMYTGQHITATKMMDNTNYPHQENMSTELVTIGDMMREAGYYAAYKGKWHMGEGLTSLEEYGFSDWGGVDMHGTLQQGYEKDGEIVDESIAWLSDKGNKLNKEGKPFFLAVNMINPHDVMYYNNVYENEGLLETSPGPDVPVYKKQYTEALPESYNEPIDLATRPTSHNEYYEVWGGETCPFPTTEMVWEGLRDYYYNCIQDNDNHLNRLVKYIEEQGLLRNTIIIFTSDHGEMMSTHNMKGKGGFIYENNIHVPLVIIHPEIEGNRDFYNISSHLDLAPTIVDLATNGNEKLEKITEGLKGYSLVPALTDANYDVRNSEGALFVYEMLSMIDGDAEMKIDEPMTFNLYKRGFVRGIVTEDYKFARYFSPMYYNTPNNIEELYRLNDVEMYQMGTDETENIAASKDENIELITTYNDKLNAQILREVGVDDGSEFGDMDAVFNRMHNGKEDPFKVAPQ